MSNGKNCVISYFARWLDLTSDTGEVERNGRIEQKSYCLEHYHLILATDTNDSKDRLAARIIPHHRSCDYNTTGWTII